MAESNEMQEVTGHESENELNDAEETEESYDDDDEEYEPYDNDDECDNELEEVSE